MKKALLLLLLIVPAVIYAVRKGVPSAAIQSIPPAPQRIGNPEKGYQYLITGDYIKSGAPYGLFTLMNGKNNTNRLQRSGRNATVGHGYNVISRDGKDIVVPTCLQCHAQVFDGRLIIGLGNTSLDFSDTRMPGFKTSRRMLQTLSPRQYARAKDFLRSFATTFPQMQTEVRGVNVADKLAMVLISHRDPQTLEWSDSAMINIPAEVYPVDVPPWWHLKKKNAMFYNGFARGDQATFMMLANLLTVKDSAEAREVSTHFNDVLAYVRTIQPPPYPGPIDEQLAAKGKLIFNATCSRCHGTYSADGHYPNLLIPLSIIGTDSTLCQGVSQNEDYVSWFRNSWFAQGDHPALLVPFNGYIAPPLDGIWVTAPYLHNGSVPTLDALLNSKTRPVYWSRDFKTKEYDYNAVGWKYATPAAPKRRTVYNITLTGYGNSGHYFGDKLSSEERKAVVEYLKGL